MKQRLCIPSLHIKLNYWARSSLSSLKLEEMKKVEVIMARRVGCLATANVCHNDKESSIPLVAVGLLQVFSHKKPSTMQLEHLICDGRSACLSTEIQHRVHWRDPHIMPTTRIKAHVRD